MEKFEIKKTVPERPEWREKIKKYYRGETHTHSKTGNRPEGANDKKMHRQERLMQYAEKLGLEFVIFSEHTSNPSNPSRLKADDSLCLSILKQKDDAERINASGRYKPKAFSAVEANIFFEEGKRPCIDLPDGIMSQLDIVIASRHAVKDQENLEKIRESLLAAIENPNVDVIGHPYRYIEFPDYGWRFFRKNWKYMDKEGELAGMDMDKLDALASETKDWSSIHKIIGKKPANDPASRELNRKFRDLNDKYWRMWDEIFNAVEKNGQALEINLNNFIPSNDFYRRFLEEAAKRPGIKFTIAFDFHNLDQFKSFKDKDQISAEPEGIKNPERSRAVQRLSDLTELLENLNIGQERIVNSGIGRMEEFISQRKNKIIG